MARLHPQGLQIGDGQVRSVLPHRRQAATARKHPRHRQGQDREQTVAHSTSVAGGPVTFLRTWTRGRRNRAVVVADDYHQDMPGTQGEVLLTSAHAIKMTGKGFYL